MSRLLSLLVRWLCVVTVEVVCIDGAGVWWTDNKLLPYIELSFTGLKMRWNFALIKKSYISLS